MNLETVEELADFLRDAVDPAVRDRLLARGGAWSLMREDGILPDGAPRFSRTIAVDLAEYGFSVLRAALALREIGEESELARTGFDRAASAFEALVRHEYTLHVREVEELLWRSLRDSRGDFLEPISLTPTLSDDDELADPLSRRRARGSSRA